MEISQATDRFLQYLEVEKGCSKATLEDYRSDIVGFRLHSHIKFGTEEINSAMLTGYIRFLSEQGYAVSTILRRTSSLRHFLSFLKEEGIYDGEIPKYDPPKKEKRLPDVLSLEEVDALLEAPDPKTPSGLRDQAMLELMYATGLRVSELLSLRLRDIDLERNIVRVIGKGDKERLVYFDARTKVHLHNYLESRQDDNQALFVTLNQPYNRLKISGVEKRLRELGRRLKIDKVHPHKFRRTLATRAIDKGMPIEQVQKLLGHQKIDTTLEYAMVNQNNVKMSHRKYIG